MADIGYHDEFWLHNGTALTKLVGVKEIEIPVGGQREQVEVTDLDAPNYRRQYINGLYEESDFEILLNADFLSATDTLLTSARDTGNTRAFKTVLTEGGTPVAQVEGTARCTGYTYSRIAVGNVKEATATFRVVSVDSIEAYAE